jgi:hypothetical protein
LDLPVRDPCCTWKQSLPTREREATIAAGLAWSDGWASKCETYSRGSGLNRSRGLSSLMFQRPALKMDGCPPGPECPRLHAAYNGLPTARSRSNASPVQFLPDRLPPAHTSLDSSSPSFPPSPMPIHRRYCLLVVLLLHGICYLVVSVRGS